MPATKEKESRVLLGDREAHEHWMNVAWEHSQIGGDPQVALAAAREARKAGAPPAAVNFRMGMLLFGLGELPEACEAFSLAVSHSPEGSYLSDAAGLARAEVLARLGHADLALAALSSIKDNAGLWMGRLLSVSMLAQELMARGPGGVSCRLGSIPEIGLGQ